MNQHFSADHVVDAYGNPNGGQSRAVGVVVDWQAGPLGRHPDRAQANGAFVETVIAIAKERIEFYQRTAAGRFACQENADAIAYLEDALRVLENRTARREEAGIEGTQIADDGTPPLAGPVGPINEVQP